jgi:hypothetical protein
MSKNNNQEKNLYDSLHKKGVLDNIKVIKKNIYKKIIKNIRPT